LPRRDYLVTAIKGNEEIILEDLKDIDRTSEPHDSCEPLDKEHGRIERRRCDADDLTAAEWDGCRDLYGRKQAIRIRRTIECVKKRGIIRRHHLPTDLARQGQGRFQHAAPHRPRALAH